MSCAARSGATAASARGRTPSPHDRDTHRARWSLAARAYGEMPTRAKRCTTRHPPAAKESAISKTPAVAVASDGA